MGFTDEEIVALSGAHTIGRAFKERSGACPFGYGEKLALPHILQAVPQALEGLLTR